MSTRRGFLASSLAFAAPRAPRLLLHGSWQDVNIGDVGHTPGALSILEKHFPSAEITLWPRKLGGPARAMLTAAYPRVRIVEGSLNPDGRPTTPELAQAWDATDLYISGSGSGFPDSNFAAAFHRRTGKPVGVFGVSTDPVSGFGSGREPEGGTLAWIRDRAKQLPANHLAGDVRYVADRAAFFFCRDSISVEYLRSQGAKAPILEFGPDSQLGMHLRDDANGFAYLAARSLEPGKFICVIPRLRYTPYYRIRNEKRVPSDDVKDAINNRTTESDHAKLRDLITSYVRNTGGKVLACAEMTYQVAMAKEVLVDPLPAAIKRNVVWRDKFWLPDEAASVYSKAAAVISAECHSPLIALRNGTPGFYVRQPTDTCKGQMYADFGAGEWLFEVDESSGASLWARLERVVRDPKGARDKVRQIMAVVEAKQRRMVDAVRSASTAPR
ncbi:MAG: polysaccharide pyruvyl transferase family protein [Bryobacteraceae bacterium]